MNRIKWHFKIVSIKKTRALDIFNSNLKKEQNNSDVTLL